MRKLKADIWREIRYTLSYGMDAFISRSWGALWCAQPLSDQPVGDRYILADWSDDFVCQCGWQHDDGDDGGLAGGLLYALAIRFAGL